MNNNDTTIRNNPLALAQADLEDALTSYVNAKQSYAADHSDANLQAMEDARSNYLRVERMVTRGIMVFSEMQS